jgi:hypothetical protein
MKSKPQHCLSCMLPLTAPLLLPNAYRLRSESDPTQSLSASAQLDTLGVWLRGAPPCTRALELPTALQQSPGPRMGCSLQASACLIGSMYYHMV